MASIDIRLDGDGAFDDVPRDKIVNATDNPMRVAALARGMVSGKPSVTIGIFLDDGGVVLGQTSLALFLAAADALRARHGDPRHE
jgi:hypothetical protein